MKRLSITFALLSVGCKSLDVTNSNAADIDRLFSTPAAIEQAIGTGFQSCYNALNNFGPTSDLAVQLAALSLEGYGVTNNALQGIRTAIPRSPVGNDQAPAYRDFAALQTGARLQTNAIAAIRNLNAAGGTLGTRSRDLRAAAFGFFAAACHQGYLAMVFDSAAVVTPALARDSIPDLSSSKQVMESVMMMLDSAIAIGSDPAISGADGFPLPGTWVNGNAMSRDDFIRMVRSFRARFRAGMARTREERSTVPWSAILDDVNAGLQSDLLVTVGGTTGWGGPHNWGFVTGLGMAPAYFGMADVSGGYDNWLSLPLDQRDRFLVITPDRRWPQGNTRAQQQANTPASFTLATTPYVSNRTTADPFGHPWGVSYYTYNRYLTFRQSVAGGGTATYPMMLKVELDLLAAEAYLRAGNIPAAAAKIDLTRTGRGQLPALSGVVTAFGQSVPGGSSCVPRVPISPSFKSTACGDIWEALKWEKRMETALSGFGQWYFDSRGWGDLIEGTALEYPVPYQELHARGHAAYILGGGFSSSAPRGTYGF